MAEGDTIHRLAGQIDAALGDTELSSAESPNPRAALEGRIGSLRGRPLERAEARGKHLLLHFDGLVLHSHLGMKGRWQIYEGPERRRRQRQAAWAVLSAPGAVAAQFGGPTLELFDERRLNRHPRLRALGPDILAPTFTPELGVAALRRADHGRELGDALLDQGLISGIGNVYRAEGCFSAAVNPWRSVDEVTDEELAAVVSATRALMVAGVESGHQPEQVYRGTKHGCPRCGAPIRARGLGDGARTVYWCGSCQS